MYYIGVFQVDNMVFWDKWNARISFITKWKKIGKCCQLLVNVSIMLLLRMTEIFHYVKAVCVSFS